VIYILNSDVLYYGYPMIAGRQGIEVLILPAPESNRLESHSR